VIASLTLCKAKFKLCDTKLTLSMSDLNQALVDIRSIRRQVAITTEFRGYGPLTLSATAVLALLAGAAQSRWLPEPAAHPAQYVALWLTTGVLSAALIVTQMFTRANRLHSGMADEMIHMAVTQFLPAGIAGLILPFVLLHVTHEVFWMLPGLWLTIFGLGVFASCRCLPRPMFIAGIWFLLSGISCISLGGTRALAPVMMSYPYAIGMGFVAIVHYRSAKKAPTDEDKEF
jgi:fumarate reductase subunit D